MVKPLKPLVKASPMPRIALHPDKEIARNKPIQILFHSLFILFSPQGYILIITENICNISGELTGDAH
jgi:hypothetical protein